jgi:hypothetical protein
MSSSVSSSVSSSDLFKDQVQVQVQVQVPINKALYLKDHRDLKQCEEYIEVVINKCYGGYGLSAEALCLIEERHPDYKDMEDSDREHIDCYIESLPRSDPVLLEVVKELGQEASGTHASLSIMKIPKKYEKYYEIDEYDGQEGLKINYDRFKLDQKLKFISDLKDTLNEKTTSDEKISKINESLKDL